MKLKDFNIVYGGILISLLIAEICFSLLFNFYVIRFLQLFILINFLDKKFNFLRNTLVFVVPSFIYIFQGVFNFQNPIVSGDIFNVIWWFIFMTILNGTINDEIDFDRLKKIIFHSTFLFTTMAALFGLYKLYFYGLYEIVQEDGSPAIIFGTSLNLDYNVFSIGLYCGLFAGLYCYKHTNKLSAKILYAIAVLLILLCAMMSGSRRGLIIGLFLVPYIIHWSYRLSSTSASAFEIKTIGSKLLNLPWIIVFLIVSLLAVVSQFNLTALAELNSEVTLVVDRLSSISDILSQDDDSRSSRWNFSFDLFERLPLHAKLFGDGFSYLEKFGIQFGEVSFDYPHNVWISALLYGGVVGLSFTLGLTIYVLYFLYTRREVFGVFLVWYILFLFLYLTSANSIYSSRIFNVLILLPFFSFCNAESKLWQNFFFKKKTISQGV